MKRLINFIIFLIIISSTGCKKQENQLVDSNNQLTEQVIQQEQNNAPLTIGYGWSINENEESAVNESIAMMQKQVKNPVLIVVFNTAEYDNYAIHNRFKRILNNTKLFGINSYKYIITPDGFHRGKKGAIGVLGIQSENIAVGTAVRELPDPYQVKDIAKKVALDAIKDAGKTEKDLPIQILIACADTPEEKVVEVVTAMFGKDVPITGGTSSDDKINTGVAYAYDGNKISKKGISIALIYANQSVKLGNAFISGYAGSKKSGIVTAVKEFTGEHMRVIYEIDHKPAAEVYNEWTGGLITDRLKTGESIFEEGHIHPLAMIKDFKGKKQYITLCPGKVDPDTGGLHVFAEPILNEKVVFMDGSVDALIKRMPALVKNALLDGKIKKSYMAGAIIIYCRGAFGALGDRYEDIYTELMTEMKDKPFIFALTAGEIGHIPGHGNFHGNLMTTAVVFSK